MVPASTSRIDAAQFDESGAPQRVNLPPEQYQDYTKDTFATTSLVDRLSLRRLVLSKQTPTDSSNPPRSCPISFSRADEEVGPAFFHPLTEALLAFGFVLCASSAFFFASANFLSKGAATAVSIAATSML